MAGLGFKDFQVGEVLTSSDVDGYLMSQAVMRFADSTARGSALGTAAGTAVALAEGMVSYLDDRNAVEFYNGTSWVPVGLQVVTDVKSDTQVSSSVASGSAVVVSGLTATITPVSASNRVLVMCDVSGAGSVDAGWSVIVKRDGTPVGVGDSSGSRTPVTQGGGNALGSVLEGVSLHLVDSPSTTSSTVYTVEVLNQRGIAMDIYINRVQSDSDAAQVPRAQSRLTLMEVAP